MQKPYLCPGFLHTVIGSLYHTHKAKDTATPNTDRTEKL